MQKMVLPSKIIFPLFFDGMDASTCAKKAEGRSRGIFKISYGCMLLCIFVKGDRIYLEDVWRQYLDNFRR